MASTAPMTTSALEALLKEGTMEGEWTLDPSRSTVGLRSRSMWGLVPVKGTFGDVSGSGTVAKGGEVNGTIAVVAASIDTKNTKRDTHLRSADFFDSDNHPSITYAVDGIRPSDPGVKVSGTLRVRDHSSPLSFDAAVAVPAEGEVHLDAEITINRGDFGLTWNRLGMMSMSNTLSVHAVLTRA